jgi:hypothetical protein
VALPLAYERLGLKPSAESGQGRLF